MELDKFKNSAINKAKELNEKNKEKREEREEIKRIKQEEKQRIKDGEDIIKSIMGTNMVRNVQFNRRIIDQGVSNLKISSVWGKINKQVKSELHEGTLELEQIPKRIDQLLVQNGNPERMQEKIEKSRRSEIKLGVEGYDFSCVLHEKRMSTFGGQKEDVLNGYCFINEDRLIVKKISVFTKSKMGDKVVPYANINAIDFDNAGKFHVTSSIVISISGFDSIILKNTTEENFRLLHDAWLNFNNKSNESIPTIIETNKVSNADELLKYAELYERGLLTKEEFDMKKTQLLGTSNNNPISEEESEDLDRPNFCSNCGYEIERGSKFCPSCGNKII